MVSVKQNICVIGLNNIYVSKVGKSIADAFEMFFADITELIKFELMDVEYARMICGDEYVHKVERSKVKAVNGFENTLFTMDYSLLNDEINFNKTKEDSFIVYLRMDKTYITKWEKENLKNQRSALIFDVFEFRDKLCKKYSDFVINCNNKTDEQIIKEVTKKFIEFSRNLSKK